MFIAIAAAERPGGAAEELQALLSQYFRQCLTPCPGLVLPRALYSILGILYSFFFHSVSWIMSVEAHIG